MNGLNVCWQNRKKILLAVSNGVIARPRFAFARKQGGRSKLNIDII